MYDEDAILRATHPLYDEWCREDEDTKEIDLDEIADMRFGIEGER